MSSRPNLDLLSPVSPKKRENPKPKFSIKTFNNLQNLAEMS